MSEPCRFHPTREVDMCVDCDAECRQKGAVAERERLIKIAHAMEREGIPLSAENFEHFACLVIEQHPLKVTTEGVGEAVRIIASQDIRLRQDRP